MANLSEIDYVNLVKSLTNRGYNVKAITDSGFFMRLPTLVKGQFEELYVDKEMGSAQVISGDNVGKSYTFGELGKYVSELPAEIPIMANGGNTIDNMSYKKMYDVAKKANPKGARQLDIETFYQAFKGGDVEKGAPIESSRASKIVIKDGIRYVDIVKEIKDVHLANMPNKLKSKEILVQEDVFQKIKEAPHQIAFTNKEGVNQSFSVGYDTENKKIAFSKDSSIPKEYGVTQGSVRQLLEYSEQGRAEDYLNEISTSTKSIFDHHPDMYRATIAGANPNFDRNVLAKQGVYLQGNVKDVLIETSIGNQFLKSKYGLNNVSRYTSTESAINTFTKNKQVNDILNRVADATYSPDSKFSNPKEYKKFIIEDMTNEFVTKYQRKGAFGAKHLSLQAAYQTMISGYQHMPKKYKSLDPVKLSNEAFDGVKPNQSTALEGSKLVETHIAARDNNMANTVGKYYHKFIGDMNKYVKSQTSPIDKARTVDNMNQGMMNMYQLDMLNKRMQSAGFNSEDRVKLLNNAGDTMFKHMQKMMNSKNHIVSKTNLMETAVVNKLNKKVMENNSAFKYADPKTKLNVMGQVRGSMVSGVLAFSAISVAVRKLKELMGRNERSDDKEAHSSKPTIMRRFGLSDFGSGLKPLSQRRSLDVVEAILKANMNSTSSELANSINEYIESKYMNYTDASKIPEGIDDTVQKVKVDMKRALDWRNKRTKIMDRTYGKNNIFKRTVSRFKTNREYRYYLKHYDDTVRTLFSKGKIDTYRGFNELKRFHETKRISAKAHLLGKGKLMPDKMFTKMKSYITNPKTLGLLALGAGVAVGLNLLAGTYSNKDKTDIRTADINVKEMQEYMMDQHQESFRGNTIRGMQDSIRSDKQKRRALFTDFASPYGKAGIQTIKWAAAMTNLDEILAAKSVRGIKSAKKLSNIMFHSNIVAKRSARKQKLVNKALRSISNNKKSISAVKDKSHFYGSYNELIGKIGNKAKASYKYNYHKSPYLSNMRSRAMLNNRTISATNRLDEISSKNRVSKIIRESNHAKTINYGLDDYSKRVYNNTRVFIDKDTNVHLSSNFSRPDSGLNIGYSKIEPRHRWETIKSKIYDIGPKRLPVTNVNKSTYFKVSDGVRSRSDNIVFGIQRSVDHDKIYGLTRMAKEAKTTVRAAGKGTYNAHAANTLSRYYTTVAGDLRHSNATRFQYDPF